MRDTVAIGGGITLFWLSHFASYKPNPEFSMDEVLAGGGAFDLNNPGTIYASGGFPLKAYDYPFPPLGPGPHQPIWPLAINLLFWIAICYGVMWLYRTEKIPVWISRGVTILAIVTTIIGMGYLLLKFD